MDHMREAATGLRYRGRRTSVSVFLWGISSSVVQNSSWSHGTVGHGVSMATDTYLLWSIFSKTCPIVQSHGTQETVYQTPILWYWLQWWMTQRDDIQTPGGWWENLLSSEWVTYLDSMKICVPDTQPEPRPTLTHPSLPVVLQWVALFPAWNPSVWNQEVACRVFCCSNHTMHWTAFLSAVCCLGAASQQREAGTGRHLQFVLGHLLWQHCGLYNSLSTGLYWWSNGGAQHLQIIRFLSELVLLLTNQVDELLALFVVVSIIFPICSSIWIMPNPPERQHVTLNVADDSQSPKPGRQMSTVSEGHSTLLPWQLWPPLRCSVSSSWCCMILRGGGGGWTCLGMKTTTCTSLPTLISTTWASRGEAAVHVQPWAESHSELSPENDTQTHTGVVKCAVKNLK